MAQTIKHIFEWIVHPEHWRLITGCVSIFGTGVGLWINYRIGKLRRDYKLAVRFDGYLKCAAALRAEWGVFLASSFSEIELTQSIGRCLPLLHDLIDLAPTAPIKNTSKILLGKISRKRSIKTLFLSLGPQVKLDKTELSDAWSDLVNLHEFLQSDKQDRKTRTL